MASSCAAHTQAAQPHKTWTRRTRMPHIIIYEFFYPVLTLSVLPRCKHVPMSSSNIFKNTDDRDRPEKSNTQHLVFNLVNHVKFAYFTFFPSIWIDYFVIEYCCCHYTAVHVSILCPFRVFGVSCWCDSVYSIQMVSLRRFAYMQCMANVEKSIANLNTSIFYYYLSPVSRRVRKFEMV